MKTRQYIVIVDKDDQGRRAKVRTAATSSSQAARQVTDALGAPPHAFSVAYPVGRSRARILIEKIRRHDIDLLIGTPGTPHHIAQDSHQWIGLAFTLAAGADAYHGRIVEDYRPGIGGSLAELQDVDSAIRKLMRQAAPQTVEDACELAYRYGKALEARHR